jgi:hypothetical protein
MRHIPVPALGALFLLLSVPPAVGDDRLFVRPWAELEPIVRIEAEYPIPLETAGRWVLDEARALLSGMVYGWTFSWTPGDLARKVDDRFDLVPVAEIPWGSDRLAVRQTQVEEARFFAQVSFLMATGTGEAPILDGRGGKLTALANAIKDAVRNHLRTRFLNKPREIRGEIVLWEDPRSWVASGSYHAVAKVRLRVLDVVPYRIF